MKRKLNEIISLKDKESILFLEEKLGPSWFNYPKACEFQLKSYKWYLKQKERK